MNQLPLFLPARPANRSPSQDCDREWIRQTVTWRWSILAWLRDLRPVGSSGKTSPAYCPATEAGILVHSSERWGNSGIATPTECWTLNTLEYPSDDEESSLSDILVTGDVPQRFYLSPRACQGILRRAERRGKELPQRLRQALLIQGQETKESKQTP